MSDAKALVPELVASVPATVERGVGVVRRKERLVIRRLRRVVEQGALDATRIDDEGPAPVPADGEPAWNAERLRVARDMRKSKRHAPIYLEYADRAVQRQEAREAGQQAPTQLNIGTINYVQPIVYPAVELETKE